MSVLVVGAGPTGLAMACGLLQGGAQVRIVDAAPGPATTSRALGLQPRGVEVLDRLGALGDLPDRGVQVREVVINVGGREITRLRIGGVTRLVTRPGVMMSQAEVEAQLRRRLAELGGRVEWGHEVTTLDHDGWIVGCDGAHSRVRHELGLPFEGQPYPQDWLLADVGRTRLRAQWHELFKRFDAVICPVMPTPAYPHDHSPQQEARRIKIDGKDYAYPDQLAWPGIATLPGLPATAIPLGLSPEGLPVGIQIVGPWLEDRTPLKLAELIEREFGGFVPPPVFDD